MSFTKEKFLPSSALVFCYLCVLAQGSGLKENMSSLSYLDDESNKTLDFMTWIDENERYLLCQEFMELAVIQGSMTTPGSEISHGLSGEQAEIMMQECNSLRRKKRHTGTKWCGRGNIAYNDSDLGTEADTDRCCRTHDMCNDFILAGESGHGLNNTRQYTALNCRCDRELYDCLSNVDTLTSNTVGNLYFNILRSRCFKKDYPQTNKCKTYAILKNIICVEYEKDTTKPKVYQWFPAKIYRKVPIPIIDETVSLE